MSGVRSWGGAACCNLGRLLWDGCPCNPSMSPLHPNLHIQHSCGILHPHGVSHPHPAFLSHSTSPFASCTFITSQILIQISVIFCTSLMSHIPLMFHILFPSHIYNTPYILVASSTLTETSCVSIPISIPTATTPSILAASCIPIISPPYPTSLWHSRGTWCPVGTVGSGVSPQVGAAG